MKYRSVTQSGEEAKSTKDFLEHITKNINLNIQGLNVFWT